jgi:hypothetical protein
MDRLNINIEKYAKLAPKSLTWQRISVCVMLQKYQKWYGDHIIPEWLGKFVMDCRNFIGRK